MDWFKRKWIVDEEKGELEFLSAVFGTTDIICADEDVSTFQVIHIAGDFYVVELVSIAGDSFKKYFSFPSHTYKPQKLEETESGVETYDKAEATLKEEMMKTSFNKKTNEDSFDYSMQLTGHDLLYYQPVLYDCYLERKGMYACIQTISNRFYVKVGENPKYLSMASDQEEGERRKKRRGNGFSMKRTYTSPDETGRCTLHMELKCNDVVAHIHAYSNG